MLSIKAKQYLRKAMQNKIILAAWIIFNDTKFKV